MQLFVVNTAELLYMAKKVDPKMLFCHQRNLHWGKMLAKDLEHEVVTIAMNDIDQQTSSNHDDDTNFEYLFNYDHKKSKSYPDGVPVACKDVRKDVAIITMSSGTTGKPKAVPCSHMNIIADYGSKFARSMKIRFGCTASLDYVSGRLIILGAIESGYTAIIINGFEPKSYCQAIEKYKINLVYLGAASFYNFITYPQIDDYDLSSISVVFPMGAKIIYLDELRIFFEKHPNIRFVRQGYGTSELSGVAMNSLSPDEYLIDCANCGLLLASVEAKIVDPDTGALLGNNQEGLIHIKSLKTFLGYYDVNFKRNNNANDDNNDVDPFIRDKSIYDEDGFYKTGDLAYFNEKDELYIIGRKNELMSCRGAKKVLPQELEELISTHPAVHKVCVLGIQNKRELTLHCPRAFIVVKENYYHDENILLSSRVAKDECSTYQLSSTQDEEEKLEHKGEHKLCSLPKQRRHLIEEDIMIFVDERIGWEKQLTGGIVILDDIGTRGATGKVDKNYLRSLTLEQVEIYGDRSQ